ncbi:hypothetical protein RKD28_007080 [Streptomyces sp. SAI-229]
MARTRPGRVRASFGTARLVLQRAEVDHAPGLPPRNPDPAGPDGEEGVEDRAGPDGPARRCLPGERGNHSGPASQGSISTESVWTVMRTGVKVVASTGDSPVPGLRA